MRQVEGWVSWEASTAILPGQEPAAVPERLRRHPPRDTGQPMVVTAREIQRFMAIEPWMVFWEAVREGLLPKKAPEPGAALSG